METNKKTAGAKKTGKTYSAKFLKRKMKGRGDKAIYVSPEYHEKLTHIVKVIGKSEIPLYAILDNILEHHFELFSEEIIKELTKIKPLLAMEKIIRNMSVDNYCPACTGQDYH
jgi:hypothetical protein